SPFLARRHRRTLVIGAALIAVALSSQAAAATALVSPPSSVIQQLSKPELGVTQQRPVTVNLQSLDPRSGTAARHLSVQLFDGQAVTLALDRVERRSPGNCTWHGSVEGLPQSRALLTVVNGSLAGSIDLGPYVLAAVGSYEIQPQASGVHSLRQLDQSAFPP